LELHSSVIETIIESAAHLSEQDKAEKLLPVILEIVRDDSDEEKRIIGLDLLDRVAEHIGRDIC